LIAIFLWIPDTRTLYDVPSSVSRRLRVLGDMFSDCCYLYAGLAKRLPMQFFELLKKTAKEGDPGISDSDTVKLIDKIFSARFGGYFGPIVLNIGDNMRTMHKLDLIADIVIPGHDPELLRMNVIPDKYDIENV